MKTAAILKAKLSKEIDNAGISVTRLASSKKDYVTMAIYNRRAGAGRPDLASRVGGG